MRSGKTLLSVFAILTLISCGSSESLSDYYGTSLSSLTDSEQSSVCSLLEEYFADSEKEVTCTAAPESNIFSFKFKESEGPTYKVALPDYNSCMQDENDCDVEDIDKCWQQMAEDACSYLTDANCAEMVECLLGEVDTTPENGAEYDGISRVESGSSLIWKLEDETVDTTQFKFCYEKDQTTKTSQILYVSLDGDSSSGIVIEADNFSENCLTVPVTSGQSYKFELIVTNNSQSSMLFVPDNKLTLESVKGTHFVKLRYYSSIYEGNYSF